MSSLDHCSPVGAPQLQDLRLNAGALDASAHDVGDAADYTRIVRRTNVDLLPGDVAFQSVQPGQGGLPHGRAIGEDVVSGGGSGRHGGIERVSVREIARCS